METNEYIKLQTNKINDKQTDGWIIEYEQNKNQ